jgi:hypothetical protein
MSARVGRSGSVARCSIHHTSEWTEPGRGQTSESSSQIFRRTHVLLLWQRSTTTNITNIKTTSTLQNAPLDVVGQLSLQAALGLLHVHDIRGGHLGVRRVRQGRRHLLLGMVVVVIVVVGGVRHRQHSPSEDGRGKGNVVACMQTRSTWPPIWLDGR